MASIIQVDTIQTSGGTNAITFNSSGYITKPSQPCFSVRRNAGLVPAATIIVWDQIFFNVGSGYNSSNGYFTAPVTGKYFFTYWALSNNTSNWFIQSWWKNGSRYNNSSGTPYVQQWCYSTSNDTTNSASILMDLAAGDNMYIYNDNYGPMYGSGYNNFSGWLVA
jgi:hypothetical protein